MKNARCIHNKTGHTGTIIYEMNSFSPPQWGIQWDSGKQIEEKGLQYFWQDKSAIIFNPTNPIV